MILRRVFGRLKISDLFTSIAAAACLTSLALAAETPGDLRVNGARLNATMEEMKSFGVNAEGGSDRIAFSDHNKDALAYLAGLMERAGLETRIDVAGNLIGRRAGINPSLAPLVAGSHVDTVVNGGHYDGVVGSMAAIEAAATLNDADIRLNHPLEIVVWTNEEAGKTGSRSYAGAVAETEFALTALGDKTIGEGLRFLGGDPAQLSENKKEPGEIAAYVELHVEQGAILDRKNIDIGVVDGIVGIKRWNVRVEGFANHAGTTPMDQRQDALLAAADFIKSVRRIVTETPGPQVGTVGRLSVEPDVPNVIPGAVALSLEIRDLDMAKIDRLYKDIAENADQLAREHSVSIDIQQYYESPAAISDQRISMLVADAADSLALSRQNMPSGAGHDAQSFKDIAPIGMIFVPSVNGVSHAPSEYTAPEDIENGGNVLLRVILGMDAAFALEE